MMNINISSSLSKSLEKQGIVTILGSDYSTEKTKLAQVTSLRRTLSADMSSKKWLTQHGFSPMKKIASSKELSLSLVDDNHSNHEEYEQKMNKEDYEKPGQFDIWSSIISQNKANNNIQEPPPYIHPLVKRSSSSLSEKSLEICTESLGSETGADVFSSLQASDEIGDVEFEKEGEEEEEEEEKVSQLNLVANCVDQDHEYCTTRDVKYNCFSRNLPPKSFPPPLPILSQSDGASLNMNKHRDNGRLVLQAESVPLQKNFSATRQKGRLVLTVVNTNLDPIDINHEKIVEKIIKLDHDGEFEEEVGERDEKEEEIEEEEEEEAVYTEVLKKNKSMEIDIVGIEQAPKMSSTTRVTSVHRLALMVNKPIGLANRLNKFNEVVTYGRMEADVVIKSAPLPKSLPPRPPVARSISLIPMVPKEVATATATSFNAYEYSWRAKPNHYIKEKSNKLSVFTDDKIITKNNQQQMVVLRGNKAEYVVPLIKGCKEPRRSLVFWEPFCVATS